MCKTILKTIQVLTKLSFRQKSNLITSKSFINVSVFGGHQDGKSTLCSAISKVFSQVNATQFVSISQLNNAQEEIDKGTTIYTSELIVFYKSHIFSIQDGPGQDYFLYNSILSFNRDLFLLVISPFTLLTLIKRNLLILKHFCGKNVIIFLNKIDATNNEKVEWMEKEVKKILKDICFDKVKSIIRGSALSALEEKNFEIGQKSILNLAQQISSSNLPPRNLNASSHMVIENVGSFYQNKGVNVKGVLNSGVLKKGQDVDLIGLDKEATSQISDIVVLNKKVNQVEAGTPVILNFEHLRKCEIKKGMVLCLPSTRLVFDQVDCKIYCFKSDEYGENQTEYQNGFYNLWSNFFRVCARIKTSAGQALQTGKEVNAKLKLKSAVALETGCKFLITLNHKIIGSGVITKILPNLSQAEKIRLCKKF